MLRQCNNLFGLLGGDGLRSAGKLGVALGKRVGVELLAAGREAGERARLVDGPARGYRSKRVLSPRSAFVPSS